MSRMLFQVVIFLSTTDLTTAIFSLFLVALVANSWWLAAAGHASFKHTTSGIFKGRGPTP